MTESLTESMHSFISKSVISSTTCKKYLASDGISSNNLLLEGSNRKSIA